MKIVPVPAFQDNYIWLLINDQKQCACVDPGDADVVIDYLSKHDLTLTDILITHHHLDHIGGVELLLSKYPGINIYAPVDNRIPYSTQTIIDSDSIETINLSLLVISIPGHTSSHIAYYNPLNGLLFCGDTLFSAGCGRVFDGTMRDLFNSLIKLNQLPDKTKVYSAHEYTLNNCLFAATVEPNNQFVTNKIDQIKISPNQCSLPSELACERQINPFLRAIDKTLDNPALTGLSSFEAFKQLRILKDKF